MISAARQFVRSHPALTFGLVAFGLPWIDAGINIAWRHVHPAGPTPSWLIWLDFALWASPSLAALLLTGCEGGWPAIRSFLKRLAPWRLSWPWMLFCLLATPAALVFGASLDSLAVGRSSEVFLARPAPTTTFLLVLMARGLYAGLSEELGWRGWLQPRLRGRCGDLITCLVVGVLWTVWHVPGYAHEILSGGLRSVLEQTGSMVGAKLTKCLPLSMIMLGVMKRSNGSLFAAVLLHASYNLSMFMGAYYLVPRPPNRIFGAFDMLLWAMGLLLVMTSRKETQAREQA